MTATDRDRETAAKALRYQLGAEDTERVAAALAAERARVLAPVLALAGFYAGNFYPFVGDDIAQAIRRAAQDGES